MENQVSFDLRIATHQQQVARINAEDWQYQTATGSLGRLRAALATLVARRSGKSAQQSRPIGEATVATAL